MPLYTDMIMDNFEDYANHHEDDGVIKLQNMPEDASMEQWGAKLQEIADEFICAPRYFLMCWLASYCLDKDLLDDETYTREFPAFTYQREGGPGRNSGFSRFRRNMPRTWKRMREISISIFYRKLRPVIQVTRKRNGEVYSGQHFCGTKRRKK